jgi:hypothetical protein
MASPDGIGFAFHLVKILHQPGYRILNKHSNTAHPDGSIWGAVSNSRPYFTAISKKNLT